MKRRVFISHLGSTLDLPTTDERWKRWRPNVSLGLFPDFQPSRIELFTSRRFEKLTDRVIADLAEVAPSTEVVPHLHEPRDPWNFEEVFGKLYEWAQAYPFDLENEEYFINITTGTHVAQICLFLLTESRHLPGQLLQLSPPRKAPPEGEMPAGFYNLIDLDLSKYDSLAERFVQERKDADTFLKSGIQTRNQRFNDLIQEIEQVAIHSDAPLLLAGPTGAGKTSLARRIYDLKKQRNQVAGAFIEVNCSTLRGDTAMSTLFGHKKGAYTGASTARDGLLRSADEGVLFLDEIGELGLDEQAMLLRAIEDKRFLPVGSDIEVVSDFQLITGTNRDLVRQVAEGSFRADLFARINIWLFELPGIRDRVEDLEPNMEFELESASRRRGRQISFNKEGRETFLKFALDPGSSWTGNFRDLNAAIYRLSTLAGNRRIGRELVENEMLRLQRLWAAEGKETSRRDRQDRDDENLLLAYLGEERMLQIDPFDQVQLAEVIRVCERSRNMSDAGRKLFAVSRTQRKTSNDTDRVRKYLGKYGLTWDDFR